MKAAINRFMSMLGYVPRPAKNADSLLSLKIDVDSASVDAALVKVEQLAASVAKAEASILRVTERTATANAAMLRAGFLMPQPEHFADPAQAELLNQVRALIEEMRQERRDNFRVSRDVIGVGPGGANNGGLPG
jgi:hypothetical protein